MRDVARGLIGVFGLLLLVLLILGCGESADAPSRPAGQRLAARTGAGGPVETEEAAMAAVRAHLFQIISCRAARNSIEGDIAAGKFAARQVFAYQALNPVWEVALASDQHIPFVIWFVEQGDGAVQASISAATFYESPLLHMCGQIYSATFGKSLSL